MIRKHFELNKEFSKVYKNTHVNKIRRGQGIFTFAFLVIQESLSDGKTHLEQPIWPEPWGAERTYQRGRSGGGGAAGKAASLSGHSEANGWAGVGGK